MSDNYRQFAGQSFPLGASVTPGGVNFSVFSKNATGVELLFFEKSDDVQPIKTIVFDPVTNRTGHYWHAQVKDVIVRFAVLFLLKISNQSQELVACFLIRFKGRLHE